MKTYRLALLFAVVTILPQVMFAHHGVAEYDYSSTVVTTVKVTRFVWTNPHCRINFETKDPNGKVEQWVIESHPPDNMTEHGWTRQTLRPGDEVTLYFRPNKVGGPSGLLVKAVFPNGRELVQNLLLLPAGKTYSLEEWQAVRATLP